MLELREIYKYYNPGTVNEMCLFNNFNFKVDDGEFVAVVGSNGSGKTSMLNIICGSIPIDEGAVLITAPISQICRNINAWEESDAFSRILPWEPARP